MSELYKVVYTGKLDDNRDPEQVINLFSERFKCSLDKARKLVLSQKDVVIKSGLDETKAQKYQAVLNSLGMQVNLVSLTPAPKAFAFEMEDEGESASGTEANSMSDDSVKNYLKCVSNRVKGIQPVPLYYFFKVSVVALTDLAGLETSGYVLF
ncbi:hypothetical protein [Amphritea balenae]|uniref:Uncharacterized protein n=1 Tax=Amphritea balenae TaxID=452629 RepID=A0A3P1SU17_9GAMM|nr:hypothetical protein [Amphritea balenae]RRD00538.1 hypothetical protein EHS89_05465 [Amphritea balenae]GGK69906.1 hypothetical protein GCM10007941_20180 [Amphritea balenae]